MKLIVLKNNLKEGIDCAGRIVNDNPSALPILKNILIKTESNKIKICATNLEIGITSFISGKIIEEGGITIPAAILGNIINNIQSERINLDVLEEKIIIKTDSYEAKIQGTQISDFPIIPKIKEDAGKMVIGSSLFIDSIVSVVNSAQISENKPELLGMLFEYGGDCLKLAATDSFRLSEKKIDEKQLKSKADPFKFIVPLKTLMEVVRVFKKDGEIEIFFDETQVLFKTENLEIISRIINANFPDYQQIIPRSIETEAVLSKNELISALKLTGSFTDKFNEVKISFKEEDKDVEITSFNQGIGENKYLIPTKIKGRSVEVILNWKFLLDGLKGITGDEVYFGLNLDDKPVIIRSQANESYFYILMPIKSN